MQMYTASQTRRSPAVAEIADHTFCLFRHFCCTIYDKATKIGMVRTLSMDISDVEILGVGR